jgi:oligopeptidase B
VARLRATARNGADVVLRTEMAAGHGGVSGRYKSWHDRAFSLAWVLDRMGLADAVPIPSTGQSTGQSTEPVATNP